MKIPISPSELKQEIAQCARQPGDLRLRQLIKALKTVDDELIIEGTMLAIEDKTHQYEEQSCAGRILKELEPKTTQSAEHHMLRILKNWNKGCLEVLDWFAVNYGIEPLNTAIKNIDPETLSPIQQDKLATIKWYLSEETYQA